MEAAGSIVMLEVLRDCSYFKLPINSTIISMLLCMLIINNQYNMSVNLMIFCRYNVTHTHNLRIHPILPETFL